MGPCMVERVKGGRCNQVWETDSAFGSRKMLVHLNINSRLRSFRHPQQLSGQDSRVVPAKLSPESIKSRGGQ